MTSLHPTAASAASAQDATLLLSFELSKSRWLIGAMLPGSSKLSRFSLTAGDTAGLAALIEKLLGKLPPDLRSRVTIVSCYEAGYDGFWLHRWLMARGIVNHVIDPASLPVDRRMRRAKTDRLDLDMLMQALIALLRGERRACRTVRVPSVAEEDAKRCSRERERLLRERTAHGNRILGLLHGQGVRLERVRRRDLMQHLAGWRTGDGRPLPPALLAEIGREHARLRLIEEQLDALEAETKARLATAGTADRLERLTRLVGIGPAGGLILVNELFYRDFANRREVGSYLGLTGTPYDSGSSRREQGIGKAGNPRARTVAIELAWLWLRHQPESALSRWFHGRVNQAKGAPRRIAVVALARKLAVALWRYLTQGLVPTGARLKSPSTPKTA